MALFKKDSSWWSLLVGVALGLVVNLGLVPFAMARQMRATEPVFVASAAANASLVCMDEPTGFEAMETIYSFFWGTEYDKNNDVLIRTDATGVTFYAASYAAVQSTNEMDTSRPAKVQTEYQESLPLATCQNTNTGELTAALGYTIGRWVFAGTISGNGGPNVNISGYLVTMSLSDGTLTTETEGFTMLFVTGIHETLEGAVAAAKETRRVTPITDSPAVGRPYIPVGLNGGIRYTNCLELPCEDRCACEFNDCCYQKEQDYWDDYNAALLGMVGCMALCVGFSSPLGLLFCGAICFGAFLGVDHALTNKLDRAYAACGTAYEGCMHDNCGITIYHQ